MEKKRVNCNLDFDVVANIDAYAKLHFMNRSSAISVLCSQALVPFMDKSEKSKSETNNK